MGSLLGHFPNKRILERRSPTSFQTNSKSRVYFGGVVVGSGGILDGAGVYILCGAVVTAVSSPAVRKRLLPYRRQPRALAA